jgi:hypothetical protein
MNGWDKAKHIRRDRKILKRLTSVKTWQILLILLFVMMVAAIFLRLNNLGMVERRQAVGAADQSGDEAQIRQTATELQNYVARHMNTSTGKVTLQHSYDRAVQQALDAAKPPDINSEVYKTATETCKARIYSGGYTAYASCVSAAVGDQAAANFAEPVQPNPDAYYLSFAPPRISLDPAGLSILLCLLLIVVILARLVTVIILRVLLRYKYRSV